MGVPLLGKRMIDCRTVAGYSCSNVCSVESANPAEKECVWLFFPAALYIIYTYILFFTYQVYIRPCDKNLTSVSKA